MANRIPRSDLRFFGWLPRCVQLLASNNSQCAQTSEWLSERLGFLFAWDTMPLWIHNCLRCYIRWICLRRLETTISLNYGRDGCRLLSQVMISQDIKVIGRLMRALTILISQWRIHLLLLASKRRRKQYILERADMSSVGDLNNFRCIALYVCHRRSRVSVILGSATLYDNNH